LKIKKKGVVMTHFAAVFVFKKFEEYWYVLSVRDLKFPNDLKAPGGSSKDLEKPFGTLKREAAEEGGILIEKALLIHKVNKRDHKQYFFLDLSDHSFFPELNFERDLVEKIDGKIVERITVKWFRIDVFKEKLFYSQEEAFKKAVLEMARQDPQFRSDNHKLLELLND
jgi:8-oxo-dGTP pyrophosphatase MutT (NUDIX family)